MLSNLYNDKETYLHHMNTKLKIILLISYIISLAFMHSFLTIVINFLILLVVIVIAKIPPSKLFYFFKWIIPAILSIFVIYTYVLNKTAFETLRIISVLSFSTLSISTFVMTTKVTKMARAMESLIPFKSVIPAYEISLIFTVSLRFLHIFVLEYKRIKKAQICRGIYLDDMSIKEKISNIFSYFIPIFLLSLDRAYNLAIAMEVKGYHRSDSSTAKQHKAKRRDAKMLKVTFAAMAIVINVLGGMVAETVRIPFLFLDTIGTILSAAVLGPFYGMATGGLSSILKAMVTNPNEMPFALVNIAIGLTVGLIVKYYGFRLKTAIFTGVLLAIVAPLIGTPIAIFLSGGFTGGPIDVVVAWLAKTGDSIFVSAFTPRIFANLLDKTISVLIVLKLIEVIPKKISNELFQEKVK